LWADQTPQPLDAASAYLPQLVTKVPFHRVKDFCPNVRAKRSHLSDGLWSKHDFMPHSGQKIARIALAHN